MRQGAPERNSVLWGPQGLRAGWGCLLFLVLVVLFESLFGALARRLLHGHARPALLPPSVMLPAEFFSAAGVVLVTFLMARIERKPFGAYGLRDHAGLRRFGIGLLAGISAISLLVGALRSLHLLALAPAGLGGAAALHYGLLWGLGFLLTGVFEEMLLRGYLLWTLARGIGFWWGALLLAVAFGAVHGSNPGESPVGLFSAGAVALLFSLSIRLTGSLWWAIGFHAAWDWGESYFWGVSDSGLLVEGHLFNARPHGGLLWSGGATGPEGSLLVFPVLALVGAGLWVARRGGPGSGVRESPRNAAL